MQAELAIYQIMREQRGTVVEFSTRILTKIHEMEAGVGETLPQKEKGLIIKRQARMTPNQLKTIQLWNQSRIMEADMIVARITQLDQPDALVDLVLNGRSKVEGRTIGGKVNITLRALKLATVVTKSAPTENQLAYLLTSPRWLRICIPASLSLYIYMYVFVFLFFCFFVPLVCCTVESAYGITMELNGVGLMWDPYM